MKKGIIKTAVIGTIILVLAISTMSALAHSGRTDSKGGHKDNKNASGLGSYHYHHGYGPHLHPGGVCPYTSATPTPTPKPITTSTPIPVSTPVPTPTSTLTPTEAITATPNASTVYVDGMVVVFDAYTINSENYFKLRDIAYTLNGTRVQFDATYDGTANMISLISDKAYTADGSEMKAKVAANKTPILNKSKIILDGNLVELTAYTIDGNNYFKLRELAESFNFSVSYDNDTKSITVDTTMPYDG